MLDQAIGLSNQVTALRQLSEKSFPSIKCLANVMDCIWEGFPPGLYCCSQLVKTWDFKRHGRGGAGGKMDIELFWHLHAMPCHKSYSMKQIRYTVFTFLKIKKTEDSSPVNFKLKYFQLKKRAHVMVW